VTVRALLLATLVAGCMTPLTSSGDERYLALGDSYTIGESVSPGERWPAILAGLLRGAGRPVGVPTIVATTGWTTDELDRAIDEAESAGGVAGRYQLVTLLIGVNNQYRGRPLDEYRHQFSGLIQRAIGFAGGRPGRVVVLSIPDWGHTPFAREAAASDPRRAGPVVASEIDAFNAVGREETVAAGATWVDITPLSRAHPNEIAADGLHPSGAQYARWAEAALPAALDALNGP
jgi:lysophospholipase L1-like esterase